VTAADQSVNGFDQVDGFQYLANLSNSAIEDAEANRKEADSWDRRNLLIGIPAALFAGAGGVTALADVGGGWRILAAILAVMGGSLAGIATTLNASRKAEVARLRQISLEAVAREADIVASLDRQRFTSDEVRAVIDELGSWLDEINGLPARKSPFNTWAEKASRAHDGGSID
jgi:hypothetical protein